MATFVGAAAAVGALWFTNQTLRATNDQMALTRQTAITDRMQKATEQLASEKINARLAGVYLLERLAKDAPSDAPIVYELLEAFVRQRDEARCEPTDRSVLIGKGDVQVGNRQRGPLDLQTAMNILLRHYKSIPEHEWPEEGPDFRGACLAAFDLTDARFIRSNFVQADLREAEFGKADLTGSSFSLADLSEQDFYDVQLTDAWFRAASAPRIDMSYVRAVNAEFYATDLTEATLFFSDFSEASFAHARLSGAILVGLNLTNANLQSADLSYAQFQDVDFTGADFSGIDLTGIVYDEYTVWPAGFTPPPSAPR
ncbi:pentapeptide repeat-containing protein [Nocardia sp. JW2]|uniref:pentapeptide repeat-containing protein n=1 Tax=Nocardia sp. JW2 TaxID=3450738 RepID=UPI003F425A75